MKSMVLGGLVAAVVGWACVPTPVVETPYGAWRFQAVTQDGQACVNDLQTGLTWANPVYPAGSAPTYSMVGDGRADDVQAYVRQTNLQGWCGAKDWRLPNLDELSALRISTMRAPTPVFYIDCSPFVQTGQSWVPVAGGASQPVWSMPSQYWTSTAESPAKTSDRQFVVPFCDSYVSVGWAITRTHNVLSARLVRP